MNTMKKKGFTLIELMIVLAIIAILAVVLIPKSTIFKKNSKTAGVTTNMNTVRAYLETKTADNFLTNTELETAMDKNFNSSANESEKIVNPDSNNAGTDISVPNDENNVPSSSSVVISTSAPTSTVVTADNDYKGTVVIHVDSTNKKYVVYGVDLDGNILKNKYEISK